MQKRGGIVSIVLFLLAIGLLSVFFVQGQTTQQPCCGNPVFGGDVCSTEGSDFEINSDNCCPDSNKYGTPGYPTNKKTCKTTYFSADQCDSITACSSSGCCCTPDGAPLIIPEVSCIQNNGVQYAPAITDPQDCETKCSEPVPSECSDDKDNDGDGKADFDGSSEYPEPDLQCSSLSDPTETGESGECSNCRLEECNSHENCEENCDPEYSVDTDFPPNGPDTCCFLQSQQQDCYDANGELSATGDNVNDFCGDTCPEDPCSQYTDQEVCKGTAGCKVCPNSPWACMTGCDDCTGKTDDTDADNVCNEEPTSICTQYNNYQDDCTNEANCYFCDQGSTTYCLEGGCSTCPGKTVDTDSNQVCDDGGAPPPCSGISASDCSSRTDCRTCPLDETQGRSMDSCADNLCSTCTGYKPNPADSTTCIVDVTTTSDCRLFQPTQDDCIDNQEGITCFICKSGETDECVQECTDGYCTGYDGDTNNDHYCDYPDLCNGVVCGEHSYCDGSNCQCDTSTNTNENWYFDPSPDPAICALDDVDTTPELVMAQIYVHDLKYNLIESCIEDDMCYEVITPSTCGNNILEEGEECDDGGFCVQQDGTVTTTFCDADDDCNPNELCRPQDGDGCDKTCTIESPIQACPVGQPNVMCCGSGQRCLDSQGTEGSVNYNADCTDNKICWTGCSTCETRYESSCTDKQDNDGDNLIDCKDPDCNEQSCGNSPCYPEGFYYKSSSDYKCCSIEGNAQDTNGDTVPDTCTSLPQNTCEATKPKPTALAATHFKGEWKITLNWEVSLTCENRLFSVYRCDSDNECVKDGVAQMQYFTEITSEPQSEQTFDDTMFTADRTVVYIVEAIYPTGKTLSDPLEQVYTGHEFCLNNGNERCENSLQGKKCNDENELLDKTPCTSPKVCYGPTADGTVECKAQLECGLCNDPLGMFYNWKQSKIESTLCNEPAESLCYLDYTFTSIDQFKSCTEVSSCYDYRSYASCEGLPYADKKNPCLPGIECEWRPVMQEFGIGACVPKQKDLQDCTWCDKGHYNDVLGTCTEELCRATGDNCYYKDGACKEGTGLTCNDYSTKTSCIGPGQDVKVDVSYNTENVRISGTNSVLRSSKDELGIGLCRWIDTACAKDADQNYAPDDPSDDVHPPITSLVLPELIHPATGYPIQRILDLTIVTYDQDQVGVECPQQAGCSGSKTVWYGITPLNTPSYPDTAIDADGKTSVKIQKMDLGTGMYNLSYYAEDASSNLEVIKHQLIHIDATPPAIESWGENGEGIILQKILDTDTFTNSFVILNISLNESSYCTDRLVSAHDPANYDEHKLMESYGDQFYVRYENLFDGMYTYELNCSDVVNNNNSDNFASIRIDADSRTSNPRPNSPQDSTIVNLGINTMFEADCKYKLLTVTDTWHDMTSQLITASNYSHDAQIDIATQYPQITNPSIAYTFLVNCSFTHRTNEYSLDTISFSVDTIPPTAEAVDVVLDPLSFEDIWYGIEPKLEIYLTCADTPHNGFGCNDTLEYCISTANADCTPNTRIDLRDAKDRTSALPGLPVTTFFLCYNSREWSINGKGGRLSTKECKTIQMDQIRPEVQVDNLPIEKNTGRTEEPWIITNIIPYEVKGRVIDFGYRADSVSAQGEEIKLFEDYAFSDFTLTGDLTIESGSYGAAIIRYDDQGNYLRAQIQKMPGSQNGLAIAKMSLIPVRQGTALSSLSFREFAYDGTSFDLNIVASGQSIVFTVNDDYTISGQSTLVPSLGRMGVTAVSENSKVKLDDITIMDDTMWTNNSVKIQIGNPSRRTILQETDNNEFAIQLTNLTNRTNRIFVSGYDRAFNRDKADPSKTQVYLIYIDQEPPQLRSLAKTSTLEYGNDILLKAEVYESTAEHQVVATNVTTVTATINGKSYPMVPELSESNQNCNKHSTEKCKWNATIPWSDLTVGDYDITITMTDAFGNTNTTTLPADDGGMSIVDGTKPTLIFNPLGYTISGDETITVSLNYTELRPKNLTVTLKNGTHVETITITDLESGTHTVDIPVKLFSKANTLTAKMYDASGQYNSGSPQLLVYYDNVPPVATASNIPKTIEYGENLTRPIQFTITDREKSNNVTAATITIQHKKGPDHGHREVSTTGQGSLKASINLTPVMTAPGIYDLDVGNYTVTVTGTDMYGNTGPTEFSFKIADTTPPTIAPAITENGNPVNVITRGSTDKKVYDLTLTASEPLSSITKFTFTFRGCDETAQPALATTFQPTADSGNRVWKGKIWVPNGYPCYDSADNTSATYVIEGTDHHGVVFDSKAMTPKEVAIDNKGPTSPVLYANQPALSNPYYSSTSDITIYGYTVDKREPQGDVLAAIFASADQINWQDYPSQSKPNAGCEHQASVESTSPAGSSDVFIEGNQASIFSSGKFLLLSFDHRADYSYYPITSSSYNDLLARTQVTLGTPLEKDATGGSTASACTASHPTGWFSASIPLNEGKTTIRARSKDPLGNWGDPSISYDIIYDHEAPLLKQTTPSNSIISADAVNGILISVEDNGGGFNCKSANLSISMKNVSNPTEVLQSCSACRLGTGCKDTDNSYDFTYSSQGSPFDKDRENGFDEGFYQATFTITDMSGNTLTHSWEFTIDSNATHAPLITATNGLVKDHITYIASTRPELTADYLYDNNRPIELLSASKIPLESAEAEPTFSRMSETTFKIAFNTDLMEDFGAASSFTPTTIHQLTLESRKEYSPGEWSSAGKHNKLFVVDVTAPTITVPAVSVAPSDTPEISGSYNDRNIDYIKIWGSDVLGRYNATLSENGYEGTFAATIQLLATGDGPKDVHVQAFDKAGNAGADTLYNIVFDSENPSVNCNYPSSGVWTNQFNDVTLQAHDQISAIDRILWCEGEACKPTMTYTEPIIYTNDVNEEIHFLAYDLGENPSNNGSCSIMIDSTPPVTTVSASSSGTVNSDVTISITASCDISGCASTRYCLTEGCTPSTEYADEITISAEGDYVVRASSTDNAGNTEEPVEAAFGIDKTAPTISGTTVAASKIVTENGKYRTNNDTITISGSVSEESEVAIAVSGGRSPQKIAADGDFSQELTLSARGKEYAEFNITITATDAAGNTQQETATVIYDKKGPEIIFKNPYEVCDEKSCDYYTATNSVVVEVETLLDSSCKIDPYKTGDFISMNGGKNLHSYSDYGVITDNEYEFSVSCTDDALGNTNTKSISFTVDTIAPDVALTLSNGELQNEEQNAWEILHREDGLIKTTIVAEDSKTTKDKLRCVYVSCEGCTETQDDFDNKEPFADESTFLLKQEETVQYPIGLGNEFAYTIKCIDPAGNEQTVQIRVINNVPSEIKIIDSYPSLGGSAYVGKNQFTLYAVTSEYGECNYDDGSVSSMAGKAYNHTATLSKDDGPHSVKVTCVSLDSPTSTEATIAFTVDTTDPTEPTITSSVTEGEATSQTNPSFTMTGTDASGIAGYSFVLDNKPSTNPGETINSTSGSVSFSSLSDGTYYFHARSIDTAGNAGKASHYRFTVDTLPPYAPTITVKPKYSKDGKINISGKTNSKDGIVDVLVHVKYAGVDVEGSPAATESDGTFFTSFILPSTYEHYEISAVASDRLGNGQGNYSNTVDAYRITTAPKFIGATPGDKSRVCKADSFSALIRRYGNTDISKDSSIVIQDGTGTIIKEDNDRFDFKKMNSGETASITFKPKSRSFSDGAYTATITAIDVLGNSQTYQSYFEVNQYAPCLGWNITTDAPALGQIILDPIPSPTKEPILSISGKVRYENGTPAPQATAEVHIKKDDEAYAVVYSTRTDQTGAFSYQYTIKEGEGPYYVRVDAYDYTGSSTQSLTKQVNFVTSAPFVDLIMPAEGSRQKNADTITYTITQKDSADITSSGEMLIQKSTGRQIPIQATSENCESVCTLKKTLKVGEVLEEGGYEVRVNVADSLGHTKQYTPSFTIDTTVPEIEFQSPTTQEFQQDSIYIEDNTITIIARVKTQNTPVSGTVSVNDKEPLQLEIYEYQNQHMFTVTPALDEGDNRLRFLIEDVLGNVADVTVLAHRKSGNYAPSVTITSPLTGGTLTKKNVITGTYSISDHQLDTLTVQVNNQAPHEMEYGSGSFSDIIHIGEGTNTVKVTATDKWGLEATDHVTLQYGLVENPYTVTLDNLATPTNVKTIEIAGRVQKKTDGSPAAQVPVEIVINDQTKSTTTTTEGRFTLPYSFTKQNIPYVISASALAGDGFPSEPDTATVWYVTDVPVFHMNPNAKDPYNDVTTITLQADQVDGALLDVLNPVLVRQSTSIDVGTVTERDCDGICKSFVISVNEPLVSGSYSFTYDVSDTLNTDQRTNTFMVDTAVPVITITSPSDLSSSGSSASIGGIYRTIGVLPLEGTLSGVGIQSESDIDMQNTLLQTVFNCGSNVCFNHDVDLVAGTQEINLQVADSSGRVGKRTLIVHVPPADYSPTISITSPQASGTLTKTNIISGTYSIPDIHVDAIIISVNGQNKTVHSFADGVWSTTVQVSEGDTDIYVYLKDKWGIQSVDHKTLSYGAATVPYTVKLDPISTPTNQQSITINGLVTDIRTGQPAPDTSVEVTVDSRKKTVTTDAAGRFTTTTNFGKANTRYAVAAYALAGDGFPSEPDTATVWYITSIPETKIHPNTKDKYNTVEEIILEIEQLDNTVLSISNPTLTSGTTQYSLGIQREVACEPSCRRFAYDISESLEDGSYTFSYTVSDSLQTDDRSSRFTIDKNAPVITVTIPPEFKNPASQQSLNGIYTEEDTLYVEGTLKGIGISTAEDVTSNVDSVFACGTGVCFNHNFPLTSGTQELPIRVTDKDGRTATRSLIVHKKPTGTQIGVSIISPSDGSTVYYNMISVEGSFTVPYAKTLDLYVNDVKKETVTEFFGNSFTANIPVIDGVNTIDVVVTDHFGDTATDTITVIHSSSGLGAALYCDEGQNPCFTTASSVVITGAVPSELPVTAVMAVQNTNGREEYTLELQGENNAFSQRISLEEGANKIKIRAQDPQGTAESEEVSVIKDTVSPESSIIVLAGSKPIKEVTSNSIVDIKIEYKEPYPRWITLTLNGNQLDYANIENPDYPRNSFYLYEQATLLEGTNIIESIVEDKASNTHHSQATVILDTLAPSIRITNVESLGGLMIRVGNTYKTVASAVKITGTYEDDNFKQIVLAKNLKGSVEFENNRFTAIVNLTSQKNKEITNNITLFAEDVSGITSQETVLVITDSYPPLANITNMGNTGKDYYTQREKPLVEIELNEPGICEIVYTPQNFQGDFIQAFAVLDPLHHQVSLSNNLNIEPGKDVKTPFTIQCEDRFGNKGSSLDGTFVVDNTQPALGEYYLSNAILEEETIDGKRYTIATNPFTEIGVSKASEPVRCRYGNGNTFSGLEHSFSTWPEFKLNSLSGIIDLQDQQSYTFNLACEDKAGRTTPLHTLQAHVNLSKGVRIIDSGPQDYVTITDPLLYVETFRQTACTVDKVFEDGNAVANWINDVFDPPVEMVPETGRYYRQEYQLSGLEEQKTYDFEIKCTDAKGELQSAATRVSFTVVGPLTLTLGAPPRGVSRFVPFDIKLTTNRDASCRYDTSGRPLAYTNMEDFEVTGSTIHLIYGFEQATVFNVKCKDNYGYEAPASYRLAVDYTKPSILRAYADPSKILYEVDDGNSDTTNLQTTLVIETDELSICRYSWSTRDYASMEGRFDGYDEINASAFSLRQTALLTNLEDAKTFTVHVGCENLAGIPSESQDIIFETNLHAALDVYFNEPKNNEYYSDGDLTLNITTNKVTMCYYGENQNNITIQMNEQPGTNHVIPSSQLSEFEDGSHSMYVECFFGQESIKTSTTFTVDLSPPSLPSVTQPNETTSHISLEASWLAQDADSGIERYMFAIGSSTTGTNIKNWTDAGTSTKRVVTGLNLSSGYKYFWLVKAKNQAGLWSSVSTGDGTLVVDAPSNETPAEPTCSDSILNGDESDVDCGGPDSSCSRCEEGYSCNNDEDCDSGTCGDNNTCIVNLCQNGVKDSSMYESDIDCGGNCDPCKMGYSCIENNDCESIYCDNNVCNKPSCFDGKRNGLESDIDCGGICDDKCPSQSLCNGNDDCESGLCTNNQCAVPSCDDGLLNGNEEGVDCGGTCGSCDLADTTDTDNDGMPDDWEIRNGLDPNKDDADDDPDNDMLLNKNEYIFKTDPQRSDTDGDGFGDSIELDEATDPLDEYSHPKKASILSVMLIILAIIALLGGGGFLVYEEFYKKKKKGKEFKGDDLFGTGPSTDLGPPPDSTQPPVGELKPTETKPYVLPKREERPEALRKLVSSQPKVSQSEKEPQEEWISLDKLRGDKPKKTTTKPQQDIFSRMDQEVIGKTPPKKKSAQAKSTQNAGKKSETPKEDIFKTMEKSTRSATSQKKGEALLAKPVSDTIFEKLEQKTGSKKKKAPVKRSSATASKSKPKPKKVGKSPSKKEVPPKDDPFQKLKDSGLISDKSIDELSGRSKKKNSKDVFKDLDSINKKKRGTS